MEKTFFTIMVLLWSITCHAQDKRDVYAARRTGYEIVEAPEGYKVVVDASLQSRNLVTFHANRNQWSCTDSFLSKMTTVKGRVRENKDCQDYSMGTIHPDDYPLTIEARFKDIYGDWVYLKLKILQEGFKWRIDLFRRGVQVKG